MQSTTKRVFHTKVKGYTKDVKSKNDIQKNKIKMKVNLEARFIHTHRLVTPRLKRVH